MGEGWGKRPTPRPHCPALQRPGAAGFLHFSCSSFIHCAPAGRNYLQRKDRNFTSSAAADEAWGSGSEEAFGVKTDTLMRMRLWTQNRDSRAINLKLNEVIRAMDTARNQMIDIERLSDLELDEMQATYERIKTMWSERQAQKDSRQILK